MTQLVLDSGILYAYYDRSDAWHQRARPLLDEESGLLILPLPVLPEVDFLLGRRLGRRARMALREDVTRGVYAPLAMTRPRLQRALALDLRYEALDLGFVDAAVIAVAAELGGRVATSDRRHFGAVAGELGLTLLP